MGEYAFWIEVLGPVAYGAIYGMGGGVIVVLALEAVRRYVYDF